MAITTQQNYYYSWTDLSYNYNYWDELQLITTKFYGIYNRN